MILGKGEKKYDLQATRLQTSGGPAIYGASARCSENLEPSLLGWFGGRRSGQSAKHFLLGLGVRHGPPSNGYCRPVRLDTNKKLWRSVTVHAACGHNCQRVSSSATCRFLTYTYTPQCSISWLASSTPSCVLSGIRKYLGAASFRPAKTDTCTIHK